MGSIVLEHASTCRTFPHESSRCHTYSHPFPLLLACWQILLDWMRDVRKIIRNEVRAEKQGPCLPSVIEFAMRFG